MSAWVDLNCIPLLSGSTDLIFAMQGVHPMPGCTECDLSPDSVNYFQIFLVASYAMQLIKVQECLPSDF